jgi:hypothetical protein
MVSVSVFETRDLSRPGLEEEEGRDELLASLELLALVSRGSGLNRLGGGGEEGMTNVGKMVVSGHVPIQTRQDA